MKASFSMRNFDMGEAFRRAAERYRSDREDSNPKDPEPIFTVKFVSVECRHNSWEEGPYFDWEFEVVEIHESNKR